MSLGIVFKGPEGIVLAADSRVTLNAQMNQPNQPPMLIPATFDNATKLLRVNGQNFVGAVTYGIGAIGQREPRTAHSFIPEFEAELIANGNARLSVEAFAGKLSEFFMREWNELKMPAPSNVPDGEDMIFLVGGYDEGGTYGRVFEIKIPHRPIPVELNNGEGMFGLVWGGQRDIADRLLQGFDFRAPAALGKFLNLPADKQQEIENFLRQNFSVSIPYQFLPLQDSVDLSVFLIRTTISLQTWLVGVRGVGGHIDVATITKTDGFMYIQRKIIEGERK